MKEIDFQIFIKIIILEEINLWIITNLVKNFKKSFEKILNIMLIILYKDSDRNVYEERKWL